MSSSGSNSGAKSATIQVLASPREKCMRRFDATNIAPGLVVRSTVTPRKVSSLSSDGYFIDKQGRITGHETIECKDDAAAIAMVEGLLRRKRSTFEAVEVWDHTRRLGKRPREHEVQCAANTELRLRHA